MQERGGAGPARQLSTERHCESASFPKGDRFLVRCPPVPASPHSHGRPGLSLISGFAIAPGGSLPSRSGSSQGYRSRFSTAVSHRSPGKRPACGRASALQEATQGDPVGAGALHPARPAARAVNWPNTVRRGRGALLIVIGLPAWVIIVPAQSTQGTLIRSAHFSTLREPARRIGTVTLGAAAVLGVIAAPAQASSWSSSLTNAGPGFESRRWYDTGGSTNIKFTGCSDNGSDRVVNVTLRKEVTGPNPQYTTAAFTNCFTSSTATSSGNWSDHGSGDYYFAVNYGASGVNVTVKSLTVTY